jgi:FKBP-type peptidyl-prolyl cis-trans isomerase SlyD
MEALSTNPIKKAGTMGQEVITFHYLLTDQAGKKLDQSEPQTPLIFMTGSGQIIPGLEKVLIGMKVNEKKTIHVAAKEAYGEHNSKLIYQVKRAQLPKQDINEGDMFEVGQGEEYFPVTVTRIAGDDVTLDGNHPLAGQDLTFAVEITGKRAATAEEITHGHVHGTGGCHH